MRARLRKLILSVHLAASIGWMGAAAAYVPFDLTVATSRNPEQVKASYLAMGVIAETVIVPLALGSVASGVIISMATRWGLVRHYWVVLSLLLTTFAAVVLLIEVDTVRHLAEVSRDPGISDEDLLDLGSTLLHSIGGLTVLVVVMILNVYKPRGMTRYGWRKQQAAR